MTAARPRVDIDRIIAELDALAGKSDAPRPAVTRVLYHRAPTWRRRAYIKDLCQDAGLSVREDPIGNTFARWEGLRPELAPVGTGSHIDAIPHSGRFDGTVGVLGGLAAIRTLRTAGFQPVRPIELVIFTSEEPTRFGIGCLGSRALCRNPAGRVRWRRLRDAEGLAFDEVRRAAGFQGELADGPASRWVISPPSSSCISNRARFSNGRACRSASSRRSPPRRRCGSPGKEKVDTPARS